jgi:hypothetical protein
MCRYWLLWIRDFCTLQRIHKSVLCISETWLSLLHIKVSSASRLSNDIAVCPDQPSLLYTGQRRSLPRGKTWPGRDADYSPHLVPGQQWEGAVFPLHLGAYMAKGTAFLYFTVPRYHGIKDMARYKLRCSFFSIEVKVSFTLRPHLPFGTESWLLHSIFKYKIPPILILVLYLISLFLLVMSIIGLQVTIYTWTWKKLDKSAWNFPFGV